MKLVQFSLAAILSMLGRKCYYKVYLWCVLQDQGSSTKYNDGVPRLNNAILFNRITICIHSAIHFSIGVALTFNA